MDKLDAIARELVIFDTGFAATQLGTEETPHTDDQDSTDLAGLWRVPLIRCPPPWEKSAARQRTYAKSLRRNRISQPSLNNKAALVEKFGKT